MLDLTLIALFIPTILLISITPGMCMTLAMTLGMTIGVRKTLWMMLGELLGVGIVASAAVLGIAAIMLNFPALFTALKVVGALYLGYIAVNMWRNAKHNSTEQTVDIKSKKQLFSQGLITALANPKGWAFMISLLPPFINYQQALTPQLIILVTLILSSEFICMMLYATGGKSLAKILKRGDKVIWLYRGSALLMMVIACWLLLSSTH